MINGVTGGWLVHVDFMLVIYRNHLGSSRSSENFVSRSGWSLHSATFLQTMQSFLVYSVFSKSNMTETSSSQYDMRRGSPFSGAKMPCLALSPLFRDCSSSTCLVKADQFEQLFSLPMPDYTKRFGHRKPTFVYSPLVVWSASFFLDCLLPSCCGLPVAIARYRVDLTKLTISMSTTR